MEQLTTESLYRSVLTLDVWNNSAFQRVRVRSPLGLSKYKWDRSISYYFMDWFNNPAKKPAILEQMNQYLAKKTGLTRDQLVEEFAAAENEANLLYDFGVLGLESQPAGEGIIKVTVGKLTFHLPQGKFEELARVGSGVGNDALVRLLLNYHPLGIGSGFFWSMDRRLYTFLSQTELPVLECFASPFNNNLTKYCSFFDQDMAFGARGNFFEYIAVLNIPIRLVLNPPYVISIMNQAAKATTDYLNRVPGSECVFMLPNWPDLEAIVMLKNFDNSDWHVFTHNQYSIHDHYTDSVIFTPMELIFFTISTAREPITMAEVKGVIDKAVMAGVSGVTGITGSDGPDSSTVELVLENPHPIEINTLEEPLPDIDLESNDFGGDGDELILVQEGDNLIN